MSLDARSPAGQSPAATRNPATAARLARLRAGSLAVLVLLVAKYVLGMYVNLYVAVPAADAGHGPAAAISGGPAVLSAHAVTGLLLTVGALAVLATAISVRRPAGIAVAAAGLAATGLAASAGSSFTAAGKPGDSMAMAVLTGVAMLCYAVNLYLRPAPAPRR